MQRGLSKGKIEKCFSDNLFFDGEAEYYGALKKSVEWNSRKRGGQKTGNGVIALLFKKRDDFYKPVCFLKSAVIYL